VVVAGLTLGALTVFLLFLLPIRGFQQAFPIDDSYISLTAARNLAERNLFAVNPDAPAAGITSPLHVGLVGMLGKAIGVETAARAVGLFALLAVVLGAFHWAHQLGANPATATAAGLAAAICGPLAFGALNGMETTLFAALLVWTCVLFERSRAQPRAIYVMGALCGLTALTRPEGYFLAASLFAVRAAELTWRREFRKLLALGGAAAVAAAVLAPYLLYNFAHVGELFPITVAAKKSFFHPPCQHLSRSAAQVAAAASRGLGVFLTLSPLLLLSRQWLTRLYAPLYIAVFYLSYMLEFPGALGHYWGRYQHPLLALAVVGMALGAEGAAALVRRRSERAARLTWAVLIAVLVISAGSRGAAARTIYRNALLNADEGGYIRGLATWVQQHTLPGEAVAAHDVGILSYFADRPVIDLVGLTDPTVAAIHRRDRRCRRGAQRGEDLYDYLSRRRPRVICMSPDWDRAFLGLTHVDRGRHMELAYQYQKPDYGMTAGKGIREYDFYLCDWDRDLREADAAP
jgi:hypothetical protein